MVNFSIYKYLIKVRCTVLCRVDQASCAAPIFVIKKILSKQILFIEAT